MAAATRLLAVLCASGALGLAAGLAASPNFETFARAATGLWAGAATRWSRHPAALGRDALEVSGFAGLEPFVLSATATPTQHAVEEVMRSCGGAVQGVKEVTPGAPPPLPPPVAAASLAAEASAASTTADASAAGLYLNRADDGFCAFNDGSWCFATSDGFEASLQHGAFARRRFSVKLAPDGSGQLLFVEAALETKLYLDNGGGGVSLGGFGAGDDAGGADEIAAATTQAQVAVEIAELLAGDRLALAVDAEVWPGGALERTVSATRRDGAAPAAWVAARAQWAAAELPLAGGGALLPELGAKDALLPAMAYVRCQPEDGLLELVSLLPGGRKVLTRTMDVSPGAAAEAAAPPGSSGATTGGGGSSEPPAAAARLLSLVLRTALPLDPADAERGWDWDDDEQAVEEHGHEHGHEHGEDDH